MAEKNDGSKVVNQLGAAWIDFMSRTSDYIFVKDLNLTYIGASRGFLDLVKITDPSELTGRTDYDIFCDKKLAARYRSDDRQVIETGKPILNKIEPLPPGKDGEPRYSSTSKYAYRDAKGRLAGIYAIGRDVTREREAYSRYKNELRFLTDQQNDSYVSLLVNLSKWRLENACFNENRAGGVPKFDSLETYRECSAQSVVEDEDIRGFFTSFTKERLLSIFNGGQRCLDLEYQSFMSDGSARWVRSEMRFIANPESGDVMLLVNVCDIDSQKRSQSELSRAAESDSMTGLLNHDATIRHIRRFLSEEGSSGTHALFMIDIDNFKHVNDQFGHQAGDDVITSIAKTIRKSFRDSDIVGRIGGDEFMALMKDVDNRCDVARKAASLIDSMQYNLRAGKGALELTGSIGVSFYKKGGQSLENLYAEADAALYKSKSLGKNHYTFAGDAEEQANASSGSAEPPNPVHLRTLLEDLAGAVVVCDVDDAGLITLSYTSPSVFKTFGYSREEIGERGEKLFSTVLPQDMPKLRHALRTAAGGKAPLNYAYRIRRADNSVEWRYIRGSLLPGAGAAARRLVCVITDITELKKAEEDLKFAELRSRTALDQSPAMLWEVDLRTREMKYRGFSAEKAGYAGRAYPNAPESVISEGHIRHDSVDEFRRMFSDLYAGDDSKEYYLMSLALGGEYVPVRTAFRLLRDETGKPYYAIGIREPRIESRELSLYRTLNNSGVFSTLADEDYTLLYGNDRYYAILGYTRESMAMRLNNKCALYIHPEDLPDTRERIRSAIASGQNIGTWNFRIITASGEIKHIQTSGEVVKQKDGRHVVNGVIMDVTEQVKAAEQIRKQNEAAAERYQGILKLRDALDRDSLCFCELNLTRNLCLDGHDAGGAFLKEPLPGSADGFFELEYGRHGNPKDLEKFKALFSRESLLKSFEQGVPSRFFEHRLKLENEGAVWVRTSVLMAKNPLTGDVEGFLSVKNINEEKTLHMFVEKLVDVEYELSALIDVKTGVISLVRTRPSLLPHLLDRIPYAEVLSRRLPLIIAESETAAAFEAMSLKKVMAELEKSDVYSCSFAVRNEKGTLEQKKWSYTYLDENRDMIAYTRRDVTDRCALETDSVTGLYNQAGFRRAARELLRACPEEKFCIVRMDIDHFKVYNDVYGITAGDALLAAIGQSVEQDADPRGVYGRLQGDHFAACIPLRQLNPRKWQRQIMSTLTSERPEFSFVTRFGAYAVEDPELDVDIMCDRALMALRSTKNSYDRFFAQYDGSMRQDMLKKQAITAAMGASLQKDEFEVFLQPQYDLATGRITGAEALARWFRAGKALLPGEFIDLFEKNGFIMKFDQHIWEKTCQLLRRWIDEGRSMVPVSVNVSRLDLYNPNLREILKALIGKYGLSHSMLRLEVTETAYTQNPEQLKEVVRALRKDGFAVEMDDFGSGYSSLNMLNDIPVDRIKLDMKFLAAGSEPGRSGIILNAVVRLARWLNIPVLAEGVKTPRQAAFLKSIGCTLIQGYLCSQPLSVKDFEKLLTSEKTGTVKKDWLIAGCFNNEEFCSVESQATIIFNSFVGAACLIECRDDGSSEVIRANSRFFEELRVSSAHYSLLKTDFLKLTLPEDAPALRETLLAAIKTNEEQVCETRWRQPQDEKKLLWIRSRMRVIARSAERHVFYMTLENITDRKRMEEALRASEEELRLAMSQTGRVICRYDIPTGTLSVPEEYAAKHGIPVLSPGFPDGAEMVMRKDRARYREFYERILKGEKSGSVAVQLKNADGTCAWERCSATTVFDASGRPLRAVITVEDITAEMERRAEDERNRLLIDFMGTLVFDYDYGSDVLTCKVNRPGKGFSAIRHERYLERLSEKNSLVHPDCIESYRAVFAEASKAPSRGILEYVADNRGTGYRRCRAHYVSVANENGRVYRMVGVVNELQDKEPAAEGKMECPR